MVKNAFSLVVAAAVAATFVPPALAETPVGKLVVVDEFAEKHASPAPSSNADAAPDDEDAEDTPVNLSLQAADEFEKKHAVPAPSSDAGLTEEEALSGKLVLDGNQRAWEGTRAVQERQDVMEAVKAPLPRGQ